MVKKLAIDWDEAELRLVAANCSGRNVEVTDTAVVPLRDKNLHETLRSVIEQRGLEGSDALIAIGRGKAELRELQLPPVPSDELPDMVRFQAIRSFASAGDSATVDFLITKRSNDGIEMIAAAVEPSSLSEIREICDSAKVATKRVSLRPLASAALYLLKHPGHSGSGNEGSGDTVLIDLLANDAEFVVARNGQVVFVRTVRMPTDSETRGKALAGELRRTLFACGSAGSPDRIVLWGRESVHTDDREMLAEASGSPVEVLDPFDLVEVERKAKENLPDHVGRLAPLVGLLAADESDANRLIDFLNPRKRAEAKPNPYRNALLIGVPIAAALLLGYFLYSRLQSLDARIANLKSHIAELGPDGDRAVASIDRANKVDEFLDGDVNWLGEVRRLAERMPPSNEIIVRSIAGAADRKGGGTLTVVGSASDHGVVAEFEDAMRDSVHTVDGKGVSEQGKSDAYRFEFTELIRVNIESIHQSRYDAMLESATGESTMDEVEQEDRPPDQQPQNDTPSDPSPSDLSGPDSVDWANSSDGSAGP